jgi:hypothetical protein
VAHELLDDLSKDVIRNDRNLQLWLANAAANNLRAKLANEATPTPVYTFTPPTPSTDLSNAIRELTALVFAISNDTTVDLPPPSANATEYATTAVTHSTPPPTRRSSAPRSSSTSSVSKWTNTRAVRCHNRDGPTFAARPWSRASCRAARSQVRRAPRNARRGREHDVAGQFCLFVCFFL